MSIDATRHAWELPLSPAQKLVLLAYVDHADQDGRRMFPSRTYIARKTGYSYRQVQRIVSQLEAKELLVPEGKTREGVIIYRFESGR